MFHWQEQWKVNSLYSNTAEEVGFIAHIFLGSPRIRHLRFLLVFPWKWKFTNLRDLGWHCVSFT